MLWFSTFSDFSTEPCQIDLSVVMMYTPKNLQKTATTNANNTSEKRTIPLCEPVKVFLMPKPPKRLWSVENKPSADKGRNEKQNSEYCLVLQEFMTWNEKKLPHCEIKSLILIILSPPPTTHTTLLHRIVGLVLFLAKLNAQWSWDINVTLPT